MADESAFPNGARGDGPKKPSARDRLRAELENAVHLAHHLTAAGDLRGAWETYRCIVRLFAASDARAVAKRLRAALEAEATSVNLERQVTGLRRALDEVAGPWTVGAAAADYRASILRAISVGAPAYNAGDQRGCYEVYAATARWLLHTLPTADAEARTRLEDALRRCASLADVNEQAWAMRHAFDAILSPPVAGTAEIRAALQRAIELGAPVYNSGNHRGCYEIYAATARLIVASFAGGDAAKQRLQAALAECDRLEDANQQAWTMRHAFDSILAGE